MDYKRVFIGVAFAFVIAFAFSSWAISLNNNYAGVGSSISTEFYSSEVSGIMPRLENISYDADNSMNPSGISTGSSSTSTSVSKGRSTYTVMRDMIAFIPNLISVGADKLNIDETYANIGIIVFLAVSALTLAYLLFVGGSTE